MTLSTRSRIRAPTSCTRCAIRQQALFQGVPYGRLEWTQQYREMQLQVQPRKLIYLEKTRPTHAYTLFSGWAVLYKTLDNGKRQILRIALPGDLLGFQVGSDGLSTHSAESITATTLCAFPSEKIAAMLSEQPEIASRLVELSARDMAICQQHLVCASKRDAREKIAYLFMETLYRVRRQAPGDYNAEDNSIFFPVTQEDLGDTVGLTNVHVNRTVRQLTAEGILKCQHRRLTVLDEEKLGDIAQFDISMLDTHPLLTADH